MRRATIVLFVLLLTTFLSSRVPGYQEVSPEWVVEQYCDRALVGDLARVGKYTTAVPREYWVYQTNGLGEQKNKDSHAEAVEGRVASKDIVLTLDSSAADEMWLPLVNKFFPKTLSERKQIFKGVTNVWVKGREAKVRAKVGFEGVTTDSIEWEFLLYKKEVQEWKIFLIQPPSPLEKYAGGGPDNVSGP